MSGPVLPMTPVESCIFFQMGKTEPVDHAMLPCRTQAKRVAVLPFIAQNRRSINDLVRPYVLPTGGAALSVDMPITVSTSFSTETRAMFCEPMTFTSMHSIGCRSDK